MQLRSGRNLNITITHHVSIEKRVLSPSPSSNLSFKEVTKPKLVNSASGGLQLRSGRILQLKESAPIIRTHHVDSEKGVLLSPSSSPFIKQASKPRLNIPYSLIHIPPLPSPSPTLSGLLTPHPLTIVEEEEEEEEEADEVEKSWCIKPSSFDLLQIPMFRSL